MNNYLNTAKELFVKYIVHLVMISAIIGLGYFGYRVYQDSKETKRKYEELIGTKEKYEQLTAYTAKLEAQYKTQQELAKKAEEKWKEVVRKKNERIELLSDATYLISKNVEKTSDSDYFFETPKKTQNYSYHEIRLNGKDSPPVGFIMIKSDGKIYKGMYSFEINVETLQTRDERTGKVRVYSKANWVPKENGIAGKRRPDLKQWKDVAYPLPITGGTAEVDPTLPTEGKRFFWWSPRLVGGVNVGGGAGGFQTKFGPGVSFMGYGNSKRDLDWRFLQIGVDVNSKFKSPGANIVPVMYRPFPSILTNTYIGPGVGFDDKGVNFFFNTSLGF